MSDCIIDRQYLPTVSPCPFKREDYALCAICGRVKGDPDDPSQYRVAEIVEARLRERDMKNANRSVLAGSYDFVHTGDIWVN